MTKTWLCTELGVAPIFRTNAPTTGAARWRREHTIVPVLSPTGNAAAPPPVDALVWKGGASPSSGYVQYFTYTYRMIHIVVLCLVLIGKLNCKTFTVLGFETTKNTNILIQL